MKLNGKRVRGRMTNQCQQPDKNPMKADRRLAVKKVGIRQFKLMNHAVKGHFDENGKHKNFQGKTNLA